MRYQEARNHDQNQTTKSLLLTAVDASFASSSLKSVMRRKFVWSSSFMETVKIQSVEVQLANPMTSFSSWVGQDEVSRQ